MAIGLLVAVFASQLPEYVQQYRQRLGGAVDELRASVANFDAESGHLSLTREQAIARLRDNPDQLAQGRGTDMESTVSREERLERQQAAFAGSGPVSQYVALLEYLDPGLARQAYGEFQPAVPVTSAGFIAGAVGLVAGWGASHIIAWPFRRRHGLAVAARAASAAPRI